MVAAGTAAGTRAAAAAAVAVAADVGDAAPASEVALPVGKVALGALVVHGHTDLEVAVVLGEEALGGESVVLAEGVGLNVGEGVGGGVAGLLGHGDIAGAVLGEVVLADAGLDGDVVIGVGVGEGLLVVEL